MKETVKVKVNGIEQDREVDYYIPRRVFNLGGYKTVEFPIPVFNPTTEYIYENARELQIFSRGSIQDTQF